jgi:hypothetical protein
MRHSVAGQIAKVAGAHPAVVSQPGFHHLARLLHEVMKNG